MDIEFPSIDIPAGYAIQYIQLMEGYCLDAIILHYIHLRTVWNASNDEPLFWTSAGPIHLTSDYSEMKMDNYVEFSLENEHIAGYERELFYDELEIRNQ